MPILDMPLEELRKYRGATPAPADFDDYWRRALAEMNALDYKLELVPAELECSFAECFHMYFTGTKGARIYAQYLRPKNMTAPHPAALMFHGYGGGSGAFSGKLGYVAAGFSVAALDMRGQGGLSQDIGGVTGNTLHGHIMRGLDDGADNLLFRDNFLDTALLAKIVMALPEVDAERVVATGGSQGGGLTLACASLVPSIKRIAAVYPFLCDYKRVWDMDLALEAYADMRAYFRQHDPRHLREQDIFNTLGYIDIKNMTKWIKASVLQFTGLADNICPPSTQFAAYNNITSTKDVKIYPDFSHEGLPGCDDMIFDFLTKV